MPRTSFAEENRTQVTSTFPRLKLEKTEKVRIVCIEKNPEYQYVHTLRAPKIVNGVAETEVLERKNGEKYEDVKKDFIGRPLCVGDFGILSDRGTDAKNCPVCRAASEDPDCFDAPIRRYAMHVLKYMTRPGTFDIAEPFRVECVVWAYTDTTFNKLIDFAKEWGNLQEHDLMLGPCTNAVFQQFDINVAGQALWLRSEEAKNLAVQTYRENQAPNLVDFCGRKVQPNYLADDLEKVRSRWAIARGSSGVAVPDLTSQMDSAQLQAGLDDLLSASSDTAVPATPPVPSAPAVPVNMDDLLSATAMPAAPTPQAEPAVSAAELLSEPTPVSAPAAVPGPVAAEEPKVKDVTADLLASLPPAATSAPEPTAAESLPPTAKPASSGETLDFDSLLAGLS